MVFDIDLFEKSDGKISYCDVYCELYNKYCLFDGFMFDDVKVILKEFIGCDYSVWW